MNDSFLSQEEIDALLSQSDDTEQDDAQPVEAEAAADGDTLDDADKDALGEIGNISMGSAATTLSQLLNQKVNITTPKVSLCSAQELSDTFTKPYLLIEIKFTDGLQGSNVLVIFAKDAAIIADLMMGGDGTNANVELSEFHTSAVAEAMNQMMGSAATSMSTMFNKSVIITPPEIKPVEILEGEGIPFNYPADQPLVVVSFALEIGDLINSEIMQVIPLDIAYQQVRMLLGDTVAEEAQPTTTPEEVQPAQPEPQQKPQLQAEAHGTDQRGHDSSAEYISFGSDQPRNLDLILDVPLRVSVVLGKTRKPIKEVLKMMPGAIVELEKLANEPVEILVNGTLIAHGEVVVINENFGVRLTHIVSPRERLENLKKG